MEILLSKQQPNILSIPASDENSLKTNQDTNPIPSGNSTGLHVWNTTNWFRAVQSDQGIIMYGRRQPLNTLNASM